MNEIDFYDLEKSCDENKYGSEGMDALEREKAFIINHERKKKKLTAQEQAKKKLKREQDEELLHRLEESARDEDDFKKVVREWDRRDRNRIRREHYREILRGDVPLEYGCKNLHDTRIYPRNINTPEERQLASGYFLDFIADCPREMEDLTSKKYIWYIVHSLKPEHRDILYLLGVKKFKVKKLAEMRGQSERNIRRARGVVYRKIWKQAYSSLVKMQARGYMPTLRERQFLARYENGMEDIDDDE